MAKKSAAVVDDQEELKQELASVNASDETVDESPVETSDEGDGAAAGQADSAEPATAESVAAPALRDLLSSKGLKVEGDDDEAILNNLVRLHRQAEAVQPYAAKVGEYVQNAEDFARWKAWQQNQAYQQQVQAQQQQQEDWYKRPEWDDSWRRYIDNTSPTGMRQDTPLHLQEKISQYADWYAKTQDQFWQHPGKFIEPELQRIKREAVAEAQQAFQQQQYQQQVSYEIAQLGQQNPWLWQQDAQGQPIRNPVTGQMVFSDVGAQVVQHANTLLQQGMNNWSGAVKAAIAQVKAGVYEPYISSLQNGQAAQQTNGQKKAALLNGQANKTTSRRGSLNGVGDADGPLQNEQSSFADIMREEIRKSGVDLSRIDF